MATITDFLAFDESGFPVQADAYGNNVAFRCIGCGGAVLATLMENMRGSSPKKLSICRACGTGYWVEALSSRHKLIIHRVKEGSDV